MKRVANRLIALCLWIRIAGCAVAFAEITTALFGQAPAKLEIPLESGERVWSGVIEQGQQMPYTVCSSFDLFGNNLGNQTQPLLLGTRGLWIWSEEPFQFRVAADRIVITQAKGEVKYGRAGDTLATARKFAGEKFFPPSGRLPDELFFASPQYNTWIELTYNQNERDVLAYAHNLVANGFPPGVLMIDDTWQEDYGDWRFNAGRFPNPKQMIGELHRMGFKVMLWICPFVSPDRTQIVNQLIRNRSLLVQRRNAEIPWSSTTAPAIIKWWDGYSALLDFTNPSAVRWFDDQLGALVGQYGVDGFKFDAGDMDFYPPYALSKEPASPNRQCELYAQFGLKYPFNEYRACWKMAGQPLVQRLHDKNHNWEDLQTLLPQMLTAGLVGYTFSCPDMIGGGDYKSFLNLAAVDQDLIVRSAQVHALMPMMQFSLAPWRVLDAERLAAVKRAVEIRSEMRELILELARNSAKTGEPIVRSLEYVFPHQGFEDFRDEFMLGDSVLVAPMVTKGATRQLILPPGEWVGDDGNVLRGGTHKIAVPIKRLPYFRLKKP